MVTFSMIEAFFQIPINDRDMLATRGALGRLHEEMEENAAYQPASLLGGLAQVDSQVFTQFGLHTIRADATAQHVCLNTREIPQLNPPLSDFTATSNSGCDPRQLSSTIDAQREKIQVLSPNKAFRQPIPIATQSKFH